MGPEGHRPGRRRPKVLGLACLAAVTAVLIGPGVGRADHCVQPVQVNDVEPSCGEFVAVSGGTSSSHVLAVSGVNNATCFQGGIQSVLPCVAVSGASAEAEGVAVGVVGSAECSSFTLVLGCIAVAGGVFGDDAVASSGVAVSVGGDASCGPGFIGQSVDVGRVCASL